MRIAERLTTPVRRRRDEQIIDRVPKRLYISGEWRDGGEGTLAVERSPTGESMCDVAYASVHDVGGGLGAAGDAAPGSAGRSPGEGGGTLHCALQAITSRADELALRGRELV